MKGKARRLLSWVCVLALCMSLLPVTALAVPGSGNTSSLTPEDKYYTLDGREVSEENADITLSKQAVDKGDGTYTVTLSATAKRVVTAKPTEVVFVIDGSGSMNWCEERAKKDDDEGWIGEGHYHGYDDNGVPYCNLVKRDSKDSRWDIALGAIETMMDNLGEEGISYKFVVYKDGKYDNAREVNSFRELESIDPSGGTYLSAGVQKAVDAFEMDNANQVMIIVADGDSGDGYPSNNTGNFANFKKDGGEVYTVGFTFSNWKFENLASSEENRFNANDAEELKLSMEQISENIKGLISDPLGQNVELVGDVKVAVSDDQTDKGWCWVTNERTINWTCAEGLNGTVTLTYTVKVKDDAIQVGPNTIPLNGKATLNYSTSQNGYHEVSFPKPEATFDAATLNVDYQFDGRTIREDNEWVAVTDGAAFNTKIPAVGEQVDVDGTSYWVTEVQGLVDNPLKATAYDVQVILSKEQPALFDSIYIEVYLDGSKVEATNAPTFGQYITNVIAVGTTQGGQVSYDATNHRIQLSYQYDTINAADVQFTVTDNYVLQGIEGIFVKGENSWKGITPDGSTWTADNVQGKSTLNVYLNTEYTVEYYVNKAVSPDITDETVYITTEGVETANTPNFDGVTNGNEGQSGSWKNDALETSITVQGLPKNTAEAVYSGWWLNDPTYGSETTYSEGNSVSVTDAIILADDQVIKFYAQSSIPTANYTVNYVFLDKDGNEIPGTDSWTSGDSFPKDGSATIGNTVGKDDLTPALPDTVQPADTNDNYVFVSCTECTIQAGANNVITVTYALDNWDDGNDTETGGDGTPDYQQALIKYVSSGNGSVDPQLDVVTLTTTDGNNKYSGSVTADSTATPNDNYAFDYWTKDSNDDWKDWDSELSDTFTAQGGKTYTYTANFAEDTNEDDIPDTYQVFVKFVSADEEQGTVSDKDGAATNTGTTQVYTFKNHATSGDVTPSLAGVDVKANEGFAFDIWTKTAPATDTDTGVNPAETLEDIPGNTTITFYANFDTDEIGTEDPDKGDGIPDKYEATVTYKVVGGTWSENNTDTVEKVYTLYEKNEDGQWTQIDPVPTIQENDIPDVGKITPEDQYMLPGKWDNDPAGKPVDADSNENVYTYTLT